MDPLWYKDAVIYQLHVRSFFDANNDGYGDFEGLRRKLPYLEELGVNTLWLMPFFQSPLRTTGTISPTTTRSSPSTGPWRTSSASWTRPTAGG